MQRDERAHVAVISDGYWKRALGGTEQALGQTILIKGVALTIVGIARADFVGVRTDSVADLWVPLTLQDPLRIQHELQRLRRHGPEHAVDG